MKLIVNKSEFQQAVQEVQRVTVGKVGMTILQGILLECNNNSITFTGGDKNLCIETRIDAEVLEEGSVVIDSRLLGDIVRKLPNSQISINTVDKNNIKIVCKKDTITLGCQNVDDFPKLPAIKEDLSVSLSPSVFKNMIKRTIIATNQSDLRPIFSGVLFDLKTDRLNMVALDNSRAVICRYENTGENTVNAVIPGRTLSEVAKIIEWEDKTVEISFTSNHILFTVGKTKVISTLLDGDFGKYETFIPEEYSLEILVNRENFIGHLERASIIGREANLCAVVLEINEDSMMITSSSSFGNIIGEMNIKTQRGIPIVIKCNSKFLLEALNALEGEEVRVRFTSNLSVFVITEKNNTNTLHIIAPVRM